MSPTTTKMENSYDQDDIGAMMDKKIKTLEKHLEIAEKEVMIAELENKKKQLDEEWATEKFLTFLKDQDIELRTLKHEKQRIIDHRDQIIESYNHYHKELRAEKEKLNKQIQQKDEELKQKDKAMAKLRDLIAEMVSGASKKNKELKQKEKVVAKLRDLTAEMVSGASKKNKELKQKEKVVAKLRDLTAEIVSGASKLNDLLAEQDEELHQKNEKTSKLKTQVFKEKGQLDSTTKVGKMKPRWKDENVKKKEFLPNEEVKSVNGTRRNTGNSSYHRGPNRAAWLNLTTEPDHRGTDSATWLANKAPVRGGPRQHQPSHYPGRQIQR